MIVAIEGIHGAGKSSFIENIKLQLIHKGFNVMISRWNSHENIHPQIYYLKTHNELKDPYMYFLMQLMDLAFRYEELIKLNSKKNVIIFDRYIYTAIVRGLIRGINMDYIKNALGYFIEPNFSILLDIPVLAALERSKPKSDNIWKIGMDNIQIGDQVDLEAYSNYLNRSRELYLDLAVKNELFIFDSKLPIKKLVDEFLNVFERKSMI